MIFAHFSKGLNRVRAALWLCISEHVQSINPFTMGLFEFEFEFLKLHLFRVIVILFFQNSQIFVWIFLPPSQYWSVERKDTDSYSHTFGCTSIISQDNFQKHRHHWTIWKNLVKLYCKFISFWTRCAFSCRCEKMKLLWGDKLVFRSVIKFENFLPNYTGNWAFAHGNFISWKIVVNSHSFKSLNKIFKRLV